MRPSRGNCETQWTAKVGWARLLLALLNAARPFLSWTIKRKPMEQRSFSCLVKTKFVSVGGAKPAGLKRRLGIGQDAVLGPRPRRRFKSRNARLPRRRVCGRAGRRKTCVYIHHQARRQTQRRVLPYLRSRRSSQPGVSSGRCTAVISAMKSPPLRTTPRDASVARTCA